MGGWRHFSIIWGWLVGVGLRLFIVYLEEKIIIYLSLRGKIIIIYRGKEGDFSPLRVIYVTDETHLEDPCTILY